MTKKALFFRLFLGLLCCLALYGQVDQVTPQQPQTPEEYIRGLDRQISKLRSDMNRRLESIDSKNETERQLLKQQLGEYYLGKIAEEESKRKEAEDRAKQEKEARERSERQARIDSEAAQKRSNLYFWGLSVVVGIAVVVLLLRARKGKKVETSTEEVLLAPQADTSTRMLPIDPSPEVIRNYYENLDPKPERFTVTVKTQRGEKVRGEVFLDRNDVLVIQFPHTVPYSLEHRRKGAAASIAAQLKQQSS